LLQTADKLGINLDKYSITNLTNNTQLAKLRKIMANTVLAKVRAKANANANANRTRKANSGARAGAGAGANNTEKRELLELAFAMGINIRGLNLNTPRGRNTLRRRIERS